MKYIPPNIMNEQEDTFHPEQIPSTETTKWLRWGTELEETGLFKRIIDRHPNLSAKITKIMPQSNYSSKMKYQKQIEQIRSDIISMLEDVDLLEEAEEYVLATLQDGQYSRGVDGFYTKEQNMMRYKIQQEEQSSQKESRWNKIFKKKEEHPGDHELTWRK